MRLMQFAVAATFAACRLHILCLLFLQHLPSYQHSTLRRLVPASRNLPAYISTVAISVRGDAVLKRTAQTYTPEACSERKQSILAQATAYPLPAGMRRS